MSHFQRLKQRLEEKAKDVRARPVIYVAFGDSVTQGCMEYATIEHEQVYHHLVKKEIISRYPTTIFDVINSGVSGDVAEQSLTRCQRDLLSFQPDLVTIGFGVNDAHRGEAGLPVYLQSMRSLITRVREQTSADLILLTPNMMIKRDNAHVHEQDRPALPGFLKTAEAGSLEAYTQALRQLAQEEKVPLLDQYKLWEQLEADGVDIHTRLANGINHPDRSFHQQLADEMIQLIFTTP